MSKQVITLSARKKYPSDATRSTRRRSQKRRQQSARQQRWTDASAMVLAVCSNILTSEEDRIVREEFKAVCARVARRLRAKQSDEQIVLRAVRLGCWTIEDIQDETGFTPNFIREQLRELKKHRKVTLDEGLIKPLESNMS